MARRVACPCGPPESLIRIRTGTPVVLRALYPPCLVKDWERRKHISAKLFFFFPEKCILSSSILLNSLVNGLLSGWEMAHITQFTSSFWKSSPQSQHSIQKNTTGCVTTHRYAWRTDLGCRFPEFPSFPLLTSAHLQQ